MLRLIVQFTLVLALCDPFGVDVPLNLDITHSLYVLNRLRAEVAVLNSQVVPISQVVIKRDFTVHIRFTLDLVVFKANLGSFAALVSTLPVTRHPLALAGNVLAFVTRRTSDTVCTYGLPWT